MQSWNLLGIDAPEGIRTPVVLHSVDTRAILLHLLPGQELGDHQVRERAWLTVIEGKIDVRCNDAHTTLEAGSLIMFDPGERHSISSVAGARVSLLLAPWPGEGHYGPHVETD